MVCGQNSCKGWGIISGETVTVRGAAASAGLKLFLALQEPELGSARASSISLKATDPRLYVILFLNDESRPPFLFTSSPHSSGPSGTISQTLTFL